MSPAAVDASRVVRDEPGDDVELLELFKTALTTMDNASPSHGIQEPSKATTTPIRPHVIDVLNRRDPGYNEKPLLEKKMGLFQRTWASMVLDPHRTTKDGEARFTEFYMGIPVTTLDAMNGTQPSIQEPASGLPMIQRRSPACDAHRLIPADLGERLLNFRSAGVPAIEAMSSRVTFGGADPQHITSSPQNQVILGQPGASDVNEEQISPFHGLPLPDYTLAEVSPHSPLKNLPYPLDGTVNALLLTGDPPAHTERESHPQATGITQVFDDLACGPSPPQASLGIISLPCTPHPTDDACVLNILTGVSALSFNNDDSSYDTTSSGSPESSTSLRTPTGSPRSGPGPTIHYPSSPVSGPVPYTPTYTDIADSTVEADARFVNFGVLQPEKYSQCLEPPSPSADSGTVMSHNYELRWSMVKVRDMLVKKYHCPVDCGAIFYASHEAVRHYERTIFHNPAAKTDGDTVCSKCKEDLHRKDALKRHLKAQACGKRRRSAKIRRPKRVAKL